MSDGGDRESPFPRDQLMREASAWFARMRGPDAEKHRREFEAWLARGALHRRAYNRAAEIFAMGKVLADDKGQHDSQTENVGSARRRRLAIGLVVAAALMFAAWSAFGGLVSQLVAPRNPTEPKGQISQQVVRYVTVDGETRVVRLSDGSEVTIGPNSVLTVEFDPSRRLLRMDRGRGRFEVAHETRPFIVSAGGGTVTARGTIFDVSVGVGRQVIVRLIRGSVDVALPSADAGSQTAVRRLAPGESLSFSASLTPAAATPQPSLAQPPQPSTQGNEVSRDYDDVRVADIVAEANRNARIQIRLDAPSVVEQQISGHFRIDDTARLADRLAVLFDLAIDRTHPTEIVLRPR